MDSRRGRKPLDVNNVIYWFKNTRAAVKRAEMKTRAMQETFLAVGPTSAAGATQPGRPSAGPISSASAIAAPAAAAFPGSVGAIPPGLHWPWLAAASSSLLSPHLQKSSPLSPASPPVSVGSSEKGEKEGCQCNGKARDGEASSGEGPRPGYVFIRTCRIE